MKDLGQMIGLNSAIVATHAERFMLDPDSVTQSWRGFFEGLDREALAEIVGWESVAAWEARKQVRSGQIPGGGAADGAAAVQGWQMAEQLRLDWGIHELISAYRRRGHLYASSNPLDAPKAGALSIDPGRYGIRQEDLDRLVFTGALPLPDRAPVRDVLALLERTYCRGLGFEIEHIDRDEERQWLRRRIEQTQGQAELDAQMQIWVLRKLSEAALLEEFIGRKFLGAKRFSVEGAESIIPMLHLMVETSAALGVEEIIMGMAHRGRLNVMINVLGQHLRDLFSNFKDKAGERYIGGGDVKYHMGQSTDVMTQSGNAVHLSLSFNPSHLEFVNPVVMGRARAKQDRRGDATGHTLMPLLIHGDAAVIGQGVVAETLNLSQLDGYRCGGAVHIVINNQIGFTTLPSDSRSTRYCTDISKIIQCPVIHVNAEDMEAVAYAAQLAVEYRQRFKRDIFIDLIAYRRHGHNEGDEPRFTQPDMYQAIDARSSVRALYRDLLVSRGVLSEAQDREIVDAWTAKMEDEHQIGIRKAPPKIDGMGGVWAPYQGGRDEDVPEVSTAVSRERLLGLLETTSRPPEGFVVHPKLELIFSRRAEMASGERPFDWATAEMLAFASLLDEGVPVRISGQDSQRGTFTHRHAVLHDPNNGAVWVPMRALAKRPDDLQIWNSPLSEAGVLGFDYGFSLDRPDSLTIWEAQFGDFANGAQVIIDQFISSGEDKWSRLSGLVLLLPHGFEGQGPEHSSARLERFLSQAAEDNMQICNPTTPAQIFHVLRRQVVRAYRKPLVIMSPKSLLRHKAVVSSIEELSEGGFQRIIGDDQVGPERAKRVFLCSGRVYFDLVEEREARGAEDLAIVRLEQLYPLSAADMHAALDPYIEQGAAFTWVQDEPWNMGAWFFVQAHLRSAFGRTFHVRCVTRAASASPATGSKASHLLEHQRLMDSAFGAAPAESEGVKEGDV